MVQTLLVIILLKKTKQPNKGALQCCSLLVVFNWADQLICVRAAMSFHCLI